MNTEKVIKRDQKYIMHTYARSPLVLEHGEVIERGRHEELLALKGRYYQLYTGMQELS